MTHLNPVSFTSKKKGPHLLILGAVHGNEPCGHIAIGDIINQFTQGDLCLTRGNVTFVQTCNPKAFEQKTRYVESNLNRHLYPKHTPKTYEDHIGNELCALIDRADILLDLHSYRRGGPAFGFISPAQSKEELTLIEYCAIPYCVYGFSDAYCAANVPINDHESMGTREYMLSKGGCGITLECGQHDDPQSIIIAKNAILNCLVGFKMINPAPSSPMTAPKEPAKLIKMTHVFYKEKNGALSKMWENFEPVKAGATLAHYNDGTTITCPEESIMILPDPRDTMKIGEEWFYLGKEKSNTNQD